MSGMDKSVKDKSMAAMLKRLGIERDRARCPMCYRIVSMRPLAVISNAMYSHIATCRGKFRNTKRG